MKDVIIQNIHMQKNEARQDFILFLMCDLICI